jgi:NADPH:quinone reductase-like Zn-dependent oxidoreductase/DNA-binding CsgD family transcriptional regulator
MKAFIIDRYSKEDPMRLGEMPSPQVRDGDVLIEVHATGLNLIDSKIKSGEFKLVLPYRFPLVLGHDVAGVVTRVGSRVRQFKVGDEVYARPADFRIGTFAELVVVDENDVALKPKKLSMEEAASIPLVGLTAWQALIEKAALKKGQKVFIQAGSGGVGTFAIQLAKHIGATVATTTSTANIDLVKSLGADVVVDYKKQDFETILRDYDVVLNSQDKVALAKSISVLKPGGKLISISGPPDPAFAYEHKSGWMLRQVFSFLTLRLDHGNGMLRPEGLAPRTGDAGGKLTSRQCEIMLMLGEGKSNKEISREAKVLEGTIKLHVRGILRKLGVKNRTEAVLAAARGGYLSNGALGMEAPMSERTKSPERKRYALKTIVSLCVGWCSLSASFEPCVKPTPERDIIKWRIVTTGGMLVCKKALSTSTMSQRPAMPCLVQLRQRGGMDH